eukprot:scaffold39130_cov139-Skeletonema_marinoi.AAC.4
MSHAVNALDHALRADPQGLAFLEQTASLYVLDAASTPGHPTTYGWWNFLNDALNEVERYESEGAASNLEGHVRFLATITRRVARRPPSSDRRLVKICFANASMTHMNLMANAQLSQSLVGSNAELRERNMGRIAAIVFDWSFHRTNSSAGHPTSAFSDPVAMEQFCGVLACNAVSSGPTAVRHLVTDWIVPGVDSQQLPPQAVVAIILHISVEARGKGCPAGTKDVISSLLPSVCKSIIGPILLESLREGDEGGSSGGENINHRIAAISLRSLESWCRANEIGAVKLQKIFNSTNINILVTIADALYSNSEAVIDAVSELIDTLLQLDEREASISQGLSIAQSLMNGVMSDTGLNSLDLARQITGENDTARPRILSEFVSAVGLQRFRFSERQTKGDVSVCRCLARTAAVVLTHAQDLIKKGTLEGSPDGLLDLLFKAVAHPSVYVCGIAVEALTNVAPSSAELSTKLLPFLQGKAIIPFHLIENDDGGLEEYINFRERVLADGLAGCYAGCNAFFLQSCSSAIEEFCQASPTSHLPYQLEAALFCMVAVAEKAVKATDKRDLCTQLERMISALAKRPSTTTSHPLVTMKACRFVNKYARVLPLCETNTAFEIASELAINAFNQDLSSFGSLQSIGDSSPLSEAANALKQLLCSSPALFSSPAALSALENAWKAPYDSKRIDVEEREMLCSGLCAVLISFPPDQWTASVDNLARPVIACLNIVSKESDQIMGKGNDESVGPILIRLSNEIRLLAAIVHNFMKAKTDKAIDDRDRRKALIPLLHSSWPVLTHIGDKCASHTVVTSSIGKLLTESLLLVESEEELPLLNELVALAKTVITKSTSSSSVAPMLTFVEQVVDQHGTKRNDAIHNMIKDLILVSYEAILSSGKAEGSEHSQLIAATMFKMLSSCAKRCPLLLLTIARDGKESGEVIHCCMEASPQTLKSNEPDAIVITIRFLAMLISALKSISLESLDDGQKQLLVPVIDYINRSFRAEILISLVTLSCCGILPLDAVTDFASLIQQILSPSQWQDVEASISAAFCTNQFLLGDEVKTVAIATFKRCIESKYPASTFADMITDMWNMHQTDDTGAIAGGEAVLQFVKKFSKDR